MLITKHTTALAVAALLAACGGGADTTDTTTTPQAAAGAMRARTLAVTAAASTVSPAESARQLMDYAEGAFTNYFPEHQATLSSGPFRYRAYSTGILLGVVVTADPSYVLNGVYVMGGTFGNSPLFVGLLTSFITPVEPGPGPTSPNNGCYDLALVGTQGTQFAVTYAYSGPTTGSKVVQTAVGGTVLFEGQQSVETIVKTSGVLIVGGLPTSASAEIRNYHRKTGDGELTHDGSTVATTAITTDYTSATTTKTVYSPAWVDRMYALTAGQSLLADWSSAITRVTTYSIPGFPNTVNTFSDQSTETVKYVGRESLVLDTGTYNTCRYERVNTVPGRGFSTEWVLVGNGLLLKSVSVVGDVAQTMQATSIQMNGNPL